MSLAPVAKPSSVGSGQVRAQSPVTTQRASLASSPSAKVDSPKLTEAVLKNFDSRSKHVFEGAKREYALLCPQFEKAQSALSVFNETVSTRFTELNTRAVSIPRQENLYDQTREFLQTYYGFLETTESVAEFARQLDKDFRYLSPITREPADVTKMVKNAPGLAKEVALLDGAQKARASELSNMLGSTLTLLGRMYKGLEKGLINVQNFHQVAILNKGQPQTSFQVTGNAVMAAVLPPLLPERSVEEAADEGAGAGIEDPTPAEAAARAKFNDNKGRKGADKSDS